MSFYYLPSFRRSLSFYHKSHLHFSWGINLQRSLPVIWRRECHSLSSVASHSTCVHWNLQAWKIPHSQGSNGTTNITWAGSITGSKDAAAADSPVVLRPLPGVLCWHQNPSELGWARSRGRQSSVMLLDTSASSGHSLGFILKAAESKNQQPSNNNSEVICSNTCTRAITTVTGYLNW